MTCFLKRDLASFLHFPLFPFAPLSITKKSEKAHPHAGASSPRRHRRPSSPLSTHHSRTPLRHWRIVAPLHPSALAVTSSSPSGRSALSIVLSSLTVVEKGCSQEQGYYNGMCVQQCYSANLLQLAFCLLWFVHAFNFDISNGVEIISKHLMLAFGKYQRQNLRIVYDAIGTLAEAVGGELNQEISKVKEAILIGNNAWWAIGELAVKMVGISL
ncbi:hypothetical protein Ahy_A09g046188 [Arachis hypogaea]|uniref:Uncharacterized protein n=1 Tax=Arachis hypogaea TaxID=3818 RepID=A0A445BP18_ARAHY|nr:hypothetical protein Ahy_A09g046188 [Arachis hypogaea]